jgi:polysaccharide pyruvyl transferase CsaB
MKRILIAGNFGFHNTGDEAILSAMIDGLTKIYSPLGICVVSGDPEQTQTDIKVDAISWKDLPSILSHAEKSDLILLGGGGIYNDYWGVQPEMLLTKNHAGISFYSEYAILASILNKPFMVFASGVGPLMSKDAQDLTRLTFTLAQRATVRDADSRRLLKKIGCDVRNIFVTADPAFSLLGNKITTGEILSKLIPDNRLPLVAVCLRNWNINCDQDQWQRNIALGLDLLIDSHPCNLIFIPFHNLRHDPLTDDVLAAESVFAHMRNQDRAFILRNEHSPKSIAGLIGQSQLLIGMRLHSVIFAANAAVPMVGLSYDAKVKQVMARLGLKDFVIDLDKMTSDNLVSTVDRAMAEKERIRSVLIKKHANLERLASRNLSMAVDLLHNGEKKPAATDEELEFLKWLVIKQSRLFYEKEIEVDTLSGILAEKEEITLKLKAEVEEKGNYVLQLSQNISALNDEIQNSRSQVASLEIEVREKQKQIQTQDQSIRQADQVIQDMNNHLDGISRSRGWRFLQFLWNIRLWLIPHGTGRERWVKFVWNCFGSLFRPGNLKFKLKIPRIFSEGYIEQDNTLVTLYTDNPNIFPDYSPRNSLSSEMTDNVKVSLIACVKNEKDNIKGWLSDVSNQTRKPDEIIIVDGGSTDGTFDILTSWSSNFPIPLQIILASGSTRAEGRNIAIRNTQYSVIAITDFGCRIHPQWLEKLTKPFIITPDTKVSAGFYQCIGQNGRSNRQDLLWANLKNIHPQSFLPSSRSVAFTRLALEAVGLHPEWLTTTGDDTYLDLELKCMGGKWAFVPEALVDWQAPKSLLEFFKKHFAWAIGDGESGVHGRYYWRYLRQLAGWMGFTSLMTAMIILVSLLRIKFIAVWYVLIGSSYLAILGFTAQKNGLSIPLLIQQMLGEAAQLLGFLKGASRRKAVELGRFASLKGTMFILAGVPIDDTGGGSRGAQITKELLRKGYAVVYINKFPRNESKEVDVKFVHPNLMIYPLSDFEWDKFAAGYECLLDKKDVGAIIEFPLPDFLPLIKKIKAQDGKVMYDLLDDWQSSLGGAWYSLGHEREIINESDVLIATANVLQERLEKHSKRSVTCIPNAVNPLLFDYSARFARPSDMPENGRIITYTGALWGEWFDWTLLRKIAEKYPEATICVIGDYRGQLKNPPENLVFLGLKGQDSLPSYLSFSDVAIIPWKKTRITQATSPLKLYEYLAMRCPVVAPDLQPLHDVPGVFLAKDQNEFVDLIAIADRSQLDEDEIRTFIEENSWNSRVRQILELLKFAE